MVRFSDSFWDKDPNVNKGYETLIKRLKDGKRTCDDFIEFLKQRAKAEDDYGKALVKISQQSSGIEEIGTLKDSLEILKRETENIGSAHCDLSKKMEELGKKLTTFREEQKNERTKLDMRMKQLQKEKKTHFDDVIKAKRQYEQKSRELDAAREALEGMSCYTPKEEDKLRGRKVKAKTAQEDSDLKYQDSVKTLERIHEIWEQEMEVTCDKFQEMEEERIRFLRNEMWVYSNLSSQINVDEDKMFENVRLHLEKCDDGKDIVVFIHSKQTGSERPVPLKYDNYYHPAKTEEPAATDQSKYLKYFSLGKAASPKSLPPSNSVPSIVNAVKNEDENEESQYAVVKSDAVSQRSPISLLVAAYDYPAQGPDELSLHEGDVIQVLGYENKQWGRGKLQRNGKTGMFPVSFVQKWTS